MNNGTSTPPVLVLKELTGNSPTHLDPVQSFFYPYTDTLIHFWVAVWFMTAIYLLLHLGREYLRYRSKGRA